MKKNLTLLIITALTCQNCADSNFGSLGSDLLAQTGIVSASQADSLIRFGSSAQKGLTKLSPLEEYYLGRSVAATVFSTYRPIQDRQLLVYVNKIAQILASVSDKPQTYGGYYVAILDTDEINAIAAPGGFIFISTGFLKIIENEDQLASVLAHEIAHIVHEDGINAISQSTLSNALLTLGKDATIDQGGALTAQLASALGDSVNEITNTLLTKGYSRSQEYDADEYAVELLLRAGYNPHASKEVLLALRNASKDSDDSGLFSTHPSADNRLDEIESALEQIAKNNSESQRIARFTSALRRSR